MNRSSSWFGPRCTPGIAASRSVGLSALDAVVGTLGHVVLLDDRPDDVVHQLHARVDARRPPQTKTKIGTASTRDSVSRLGSVRILAALSRNRRASERARLPMFALGGKRS